MKVTTAKVEHRDYVPIGWVAIEFCDVEFYGYRASEMSKKWDNIETKLRNEQEEERVRTISQNEARIRNLRQVAEERRKEIRNGRHVLRLWYNEEEKKLLQHVWDMEDEADRLENENDELRNKKHSIDTYTLRRNIEKFLQDRGFALTQVSSRGDECVTKIEVWTLRE